MYCIFVTVNFSYSISIFTDVSSCISGKLDAEVTMCASPRMKYDTVEVPLSEWSMTGHIVCMCVCESVWSVELGNIVRARPSHEMNHGMVR